MQPMTRSFLPPALRGPNYGPVTFPAGGRIPMPPNPAAAAPSPRVARADVNGIQQALQKVAENRGLGRIELGAGAGQIAPAMQMLNQARILTDPTQPLQQAQLDRDTFERMLARLADPSKGDRFRFSEEKRNVKRNAIGGGLLGALAGGVAGHFMGGDSPWLGTLGGVALGGAAGAGMGAARAYTHNRDLAKTVQVLKHYGLLRPEYLRQTLPLMVRPQNIRVKVSEDLENLPAAMKKAGMNSFQSQFFLRLIQAGADEARMRQCVKTATDRFGEKVAAELEDGLEKVAINILGLLRGVATKATSKVAPGLAKKWFGSAAKQTAQKAIPRLAGPVSQVARQTAQKAVPNLPAVVNQPARKGFRAAAGRAFEKYVKDPFRSHVTEPLAGAKKVVSQTADDIAGAYGEEGLVGATKATASAARTAGGAAANWGLEKGLPRAAHGAMAGVTNPYNGVFSEQGLSDQNGSFDYRRHGWNALGGAMLGQLPGMSKVIEGANRGQGWGFLLGSLGKGLGHATGNETLQNISPANWTRVGYSLGGASSIIPGVGGQRIWRDPLTLALDGGVKLTQSALRGVGNGAMAVGRATATPLGLLGLGTLGGGYMAGRAINDQGSQIQKVLTEQGTAANRNIAAGMGQVKDQLKQQVTRMKDAVREPLDQVVGEVKGVREKLDPVLENANSALENVSGVSGMFGNVTDYLRQNPWLVPLLLGGMGAGVGYGIGGGAGATMGGIGLPLLYLLAASQFGNSGYFPGFGDQIIPQPDQQEQSSRQRVQSSSTPQAPVSAGPSEIERQQAEMEQAAQSSTPQAQPPAEASAPTMTPYSAAPPAAAPQPTTAPAAEPTAPVASPALPETNPMVQGLKGISEQTGKPVSELERDFLNFKAWRDATRRSAPDIWERTVARNPLFRQFEVIARQMDK